MQRNFSIIFNAILFLFIFIDIIFLIIMTLDFIFNSKPSTLGFIKFDLIVSGLITLHILFRIKGEKNRGQNLAINWIDILAIIPLAFLVTWIFPNIYLLVIILLLVRIYALYKYMLKIREIIKFTQKTKLDYATFILFITLIFGSLIFFWVESPVNPQASSYNNSLFFMIVTMSTVGYGNIVPYTAIGKMIAVMAIVVGLGYTGWVTAAIASSLIEELRKERKKEDEEQKKSISSIHDKLDKIEKELSEIKKYKN